MLVLGFLLLISLAYGQRFPLHNLPVPGEQVFLRHMYFIWDL
jgi:hypothetical protein